MRHWQVPLERSDGSSVALLDPALGRASELRDGSADVWMHSCCSRWHAVLVHCLGLSFNVRSGTFDSSSVCVSERHCWVTWGKGRELELREDSEQNSGSTWNFSLHYNMLHKPKHSSPPLSHRPLLHYLIEVVLLAVLKTENLGWKPNNNTGLVVWTQQHSKLRYRWPERRCGRTLQRLRHPTGLVLGHKTTSAKETVQRSSAMKKPTPKCTLKNQK